MRGIANKIVIVTGAAQGIGRATAERLVQEGAIVALADRNAEGLAAVAESLEAGRAIAVTLDVASREGWGCAVSQVREAFGRIDGLVNNAGVTRDRSLLKLTDDDWDSVLDVNLRGTWLGCQAVIPAMREAGCGSIVNLSSESRWGNFGQANYAAAKSGLVGLTRTVALEAARFGIRANAVAPGAILTPMVEAVPADIRAGWREAIPLQREGDPAEVAASIAFLLSDDASYITGQILGVNGGSSI